MAKPQAKPTHFQRMFNWLNSGQKPAEETPKSTNMAKFKDELSKTGVAGMKKLISEDLKDWQLIELHTAVTGNSGSGKSSFINSLRGLKAWEDGAAKVGVNETTIECMKYEHPANKSFAVWDLPGVGTPEFQKDSYLAKVGYEKYDFFIIISRGRFTENDMWLANEVQKRKKGFSLFEQTSMLILQMIKGIQDTMMRIKFSNQLNQQQNRTFEEVE